VGVVVHDTPLVLFRDRSGRPVALADRCPHRNVPLSIGRCREDGTLECAYHGWRFDGGGTCRAVPGYDGRPDRVARRAVSYPARERDGVVWVVPSLEPPAVPEPPVIHHADDPRYGVIRRSVPFAGPVAAVLENALDVPHTAFLHRGLFRGRRAPVPVRVRVRHAPGMVEAVFEGEPRPPGLAARLLSPEAGVVEHTDRFLLPSIAQVEYRLGDQHLCITAVATPERTGPVGPSTVLHATVAFRTRLPSRLVAAAVLPVALGILRQDARIVAAQQRNVERFGGEDYASTPIDLLGPHINRLRREAARAGAPRPVSAAPSAGGIREDEPVVLHT
jgi:phenylpropionate dioxygenase-like ring-hydroxylating dioxygenase large terminal subunit